MNIVISFATYSGGTETASQSIVETLKAKGHTVTLKNISQTTEDDIRTAEAVVFCSPTWDFESKEGQPHEDFLKFMQSMEGKTFEQKPFAVMALGDSSYTRFCGAAEVLDEFIGKMKGKLAVPSLKIDGFFFNQEENTEKIKTWTETLHTALS